MIVVILSNQCMNNSLLSIFHNDGRKPKLPLPYPNFHLRDFQDIHQEEDIDDFSEPEFSINPRWKEIASPKFKTGSLVAITAPLDLQSQAFPELTTKGWRGRVEEAITDGKSCYYIISLDSITLKQLPPRYLQEMVEAGERDNPFLLEVPEQALKAVAPKDTEAEALEFQKLTYHTYFWGNIKKDAQAKRMFQILTRDPADDDLGNWLHYFQHQVTFPISAEVEGLLLDEIQPGTEVEILGIEGLGADEQMGLIGSIQKGRAILSYPLMELQPLNENDPAQQPLSDYRYWADFSLI